MTLGNENDSPEVSRLSRAQLRVARPTDHMVEVLEFYVGGLGFELLGSFADHEGFDGVMIGHQGSPYHLEFTRQQGHAAGKAPTQENLLVFYLKNEVEWQAAVERMRDHGYAPVQSHNPYWDERGKTFEDADGYRVVLQQGARSAPAHSSSGHQSEK